MHLHAPIRSQALGYILEELNQETKHKQRDGKGA